MSNKILGSRTFICFTFLVFLFVFLGALNISYYVNAPSINEKPVRIIVKSGFSVNKVGQILAEENVIKYPRLFWGVYRMFFFQKPILSGEYLIPANSSLKQIIHFFQKGEVVIHKIVFPEGITTSEIIKIVMNDPSLVGEIDPFLKEGVFLPDTYNFTFGESRMSFLKRIASLSKEKIHYLWEGRDDTVPLDDIEQAITLASIVEKETSIESEKPRVAAVFLNRIKKNMKLQADPTVIYAITTGQYLLDRSLSTKDLKFDSPYNTYVYKGLPPGPIGNPGLSTIKAVLNPMKTEELFFVVDGKGGHNFSSSLEEHNKNVTFYRNGFKDER